MAKVRTALNKGYLQLVLEVLAGPAPVTDTWSQSGDLIQTYDGGSIPRSSDHHLLLPKSKSMGKHVEKVATCPGKSRMPGSSHAKPLCTGTAPAPHTPLGAPCCTLCYAKASRILFPHSSHSPACQPARELPGTCNFLLASPLILVIGRPKL